MQGPHILEPHQALDAWRLADEPVVTAPDAGLINQTWLVGSAESPTAVLQWVNPIIDPRIHHDIETITARLAEQGLETPRLIPTRDSRLWLADGDTGGDAAGDAGGDMGGHAAGKGCWRLLTFVPGVTLHRLETPEQAAAAGGLVGRFHAALAGWTYPARSPRRTVHDTPTRMTDLEQVMAQHPGHPLADEARALGASILDGWRAWQQDGRLDLPERTSHGDLKISNLRFAQGEAPRAVCLLDLDTLGPQTLAAEMGDAWRSWCNPAGEDDPEAVRFEFSLFAASARSWSDHVADLESVEIESLVPGIERICLELAARFCADALNNSYFRENRDRFPEPGRHNLVRAASQRRLAALARGERRRCQDLMEGLLT